MRGSHVVATGFSHVDGFGLPRRSTVGDGGRAAHITTMNTTQPSTRALHAAPAPGRHPAEVALRAAQERLAAAEHALAETHEALAAVARELATAPAGSPPDALTTLQVAAALGLGRATVAEMIRRGDLPSVKIGGARRVFRADLDQYIVNLRASA